MVRHYYIAGRLFTRDKIVESHSMYPNNYIIRSFADTPVQFLKPVVRHYNIARRPFTRNKVLQSHSVYPNSYIISSHAARMMCRASAPDVSAQFLKLLVKPDNVLLANCGMSTADRIYPVIPGPRRFPDATQKLKHTSFCWFAIIVESAFMLHGFTLPGKSHMSSSWRIASSGVMPCNLILLSIHSGISRKRCQVLRAWEIVRIHHSYANRIPILPLRFGAIVLGSAAQQAEEVVSCRSGCLFH